MDHSSSTDVAASEPPACTPDTLPRTSQSAVLLHRPQFAAGGRVPLPIRPVPAVPATVDSVLLAAARIIQTNGHWQGGYVPDSGDREMTVPQSMRPMNIVAAIKCAVSGDPRTESLLADNAIGVLAMAIDGGPRYTGIFDLEEHIEAWGDEPGRSGDEAVALLEQVATTSERAA